MNRIAKKLYETFGEPIGSYAGEAPVGVRNEGGPCPDCGMMPIAGRCGCEADSSGVCSKCGMMPLDGICECYSSGRHVNESSCVCGGNGMKQGASCECGMREMETCSQCGGMVEDGMCECGGGMYETKKKGPSKKTAQKILRGTKTFKDKIKKVSSWADDPEAAAAWMMKKATGKWPSEK